MRGWLIRIGPVGRIAVAAGLVLVDVVLAQQAPVIAILTYSTGALGSLLLLAVLQFRVCGCRPLTDAVLGADAVAAWADGVLPLDDARARATLRLYGVGPRRTSPTASAAGTWIVYLIVIELVHPEWDRWMALLLGIWLCAVAAAVNQYRRSRPLREQARRRGLFAFDRSPGTPLWTAPDGNPWTPPPPSWRPVSGPGR